MISLIRFTQLTPEDLSVLKEIVNTNPAYNLLSDGHEALSDEEILELYQTSQRVGAVMNLIWYEDEPVGVVDYLMENPSDKKPWLGLLMIHKAYQGRGYAVAAYQEYENLMKRHGVECIRLGVIHGNDHAVRFWTQRGFTWYQETSGDKWTVSCFEKRLFPAG